MKEKQKRCLLCPMEFCGPQALCPYCWSRISFSSAKKCSICGSVLSSEDGLCLKCRTEEPFRCFSLFPYYDDFRFLIYLLKYDLESNAVQFWAENVHEYLRASYRNRLLLPVPSRPENKKKRGGDGVLEICRYLKKHYDYEFACILRRKKGTISQKGLSREDRLDKIHGNFFLRKGRFDYSNAVIIDDVVTTGATMSECLNLVKNHFTDIQCLSLTRD